MLFPAFCAFLTCLVFWQWRTFAEPTRAVGSFLVLAGFSLALGVLARSLREKGLLVHTFGSEIMLAVIYSTMFLVLPWLVPEDGEWHMIALDRRWFGYTYEGAWQALQSPWLSDFLQIVYVSLYLFPAIMGIHLYRRRDWWGIYNGLDRVMFGFIVSYCGYLVFPTRSPYDFIEYVSSLPTFGVQPWLHDMIAQSVNKRDCFPSGHTMMSWYIAYLSWLRTPSLRWWMTGWAALTTVATLYLRYHYLIDIVAGIAGFLLLIPLANFAFGRFSLRAQPQAEDPAV